MTVKAGQKCTAIRRAFVPARARGRRGRGGRRARLAKIVVGNPADRGRADGRAGRAWSSARRCGAALKALRRRRPDRRSATRTQVDVVDADAERGAFLSPILLRRRPGRAPSRTRSRRSAGRRPDALPRHRAASSSWPRAGRAAWSARSSPPTRRSPARSCSASRRGTAGCWCSNARRREGVHRPRLAAARARARRPRPRRRRRGDGRHPRRAAPHAAHRGPGRPGHAHRDHRPLGGRRARAPRPTCTRSASTWRSCGSATRSSPGRGAVTQEDIEHFAEFTGDTFYAHMDDEAAAANPLFGERVAHGYLIVSLRRGPVRRPRPGPGAGQLRRGQPALPHAGQVRRRADRDADLQADHAARRPPTTARCAGTPTSTRQDGESVATLRRAHPGGKRQAVTSLPAIVGTDATREARASTASEAMSAARARHRRPRRSTPSERLSVDELRALQLERLRWTLRHAYDERAALPAQRSTRPGVHPDDCRTSPTWRSSPPPKADLRDNYPFGMFAVPQDQVRAHPRLQRAPPAGPPSSATPSATSTPGRTWWPARSARPAAGRATRCTSPTATACSPAASARTTAPSGSAAR